MTNALASRTRHASLPARFDVHEVDRTSASLQDLTASPDDRSGRSHHHGITIDASAVEMIDLAGLAALTALTLDGPSIRFVDPSVAFLATVDYTGHDALAARCDRPTLAQAA